MLQSTLFKNIKMLALSAGILMAATSLTSCSKSDQCNDSCINGSCSDGDCVCSTGYTGKWCATYIGSGSSSSSGGSSSSGSSSSGSSSSGSSSSGSSSSGSSSSGGTSSYKLTFWSDFSGSPISIYVGGSYAGQITSYYGSAPSCGASGCVTKTYSSPQSIVAYNAEDGEHTWKGNATANVGCTTWNLTR